MGPKQPHSGMTQISPPESRLTLKPATGRCGFVDGAWWPRSASSAIEFTSLLTALASASGPMTRLAYNLTAWEPAPRKIRVAGRQVRLEGFHALDQHTVILTRPNGQRMVLLVIPSGTTELRGNAVLAKAAKRDSTASPSDLLADPEPASAAATGETSPEARWETDGGYVPTAR